MKRVKCFLLTSRLFPTLPGAQEMTSAYFLELTPDAQSVSTAGTELATTGNGSTAIFHNASTIVFSQEMVGASYSYAKTNQDHALHSASLFCRIGREGIHGFAVGFRYFKDPKVLDCRLHVRDLEAAYFRNVAKNLSLSLTLRYLRVKAVESVDSRNSVCLDFGAIYYRNMALLDEVISWNIDFQTANLGRELDGQKSLARLGLEGTIDLSFDVENRLQVVLNFNYLLLSKIRHLQAGVEAEYNFLKYGVVHAGYRFGDKDKGVGNHGTLGCGINLWPIRTDFSYALADKNCFMRRTWQLGVGVVL